jgi:hypothetical protein
MGNRANVIFSDPKSGYISPVIYLHWNGGAESIYAFLDELDRRKVRTTIGDPSYEVARFVHLVADFFDGEGKAGSLSLGVLNAPTAITPEALEQLNTDMSDNGFFVVTRGIPGIGRLVRRYVMNGHGGLKALTKAQVDAERESAYKDKYLDPTDGIPAAFVKMRPEIKPYG